jgi:predicted nucleic acid-binding protein
MGASLFAEYESLMRRERLFSGSILDADEREALLNAFIGVCDWTHIYFLWRPNPRDEADNHVIELAIAGGANAIVTKNLRDFRRMELLFPDLLILAPRDFMEKSSSWEP